MGVTIIRGLFYLSLPPNTGEKNSEDLGPVLFSVVKLILLNGVGVGVGYLAVKMGVTAYTTSWCTYFATVLNFSMSIFTFFT